MTFEEALIDLPNHPDIVSYGKLMRAHIVPNKERDKIHYTANRTTAEYNSEIAKEYSTDGQFRIHYHQLD